MRKFFLCSLLLAAAAAGVFYGITHQKASQTHAPSLVGEDTLLFIHCPDIRQSRSRWHKTALYQIAHEAEVLSFLEQPKAQLPNAGKVQSYLRDLESADPREAFFAIHSISSTNPSFVAGALCMGEKAKVESALSLAEKSLQKRWPEGKRGETRYAGVSIQTLTHEKTTMAAAWVGRWILVGDDIELIKATIDRARHGAGPGTLGQSSRYQKSVAHLPEKGELIAFIQPQPLAEGLYSLAGSAALSMGDDSMKDLKAIEAICFGLKFDGVNLRDTIFTLTSARPNQPVLSQQSLQLTSKNTLVYLAGLMDLNLAAQQLAKLPRNAAAPSPLEELESALGKHGITFGGIAAMLGNECSLILDWPANSPQPSLILSMEVKDAPLTTKTIDTLTNGQMGNPPWKHTSKDGVELFGFASLPMIAPTVAVTDTQLIFALDATSVNDVLKKQSGTAGGLQQTQLFQATESELVKPNQSFGYVDANALFERVYSASRPLIMLWGGFNPSVRNAIDVNRLPSTESISRHLQPIAFSSTKLPDGYLAESIGPVTFTQSLVAVGIGTAAAVIPMAKSYMTAASLTHLPAPVSANPTMAPTPMPSPLPTAGHRPRKNQSQAAPAAPGKAKEAIAPNSPKAPPTESAIPGTAPIITMKMDLTFDSPDFGGKRLARLGVAAAIPGPPNVATSTARLPAP